MIKQSKRPVVLTVKGKEESKNAAGRPARGFFADFKASNGISG